jgi:predicted RNase H-like nuclease (RuvC/YqgF family)
MGYGIQFKPDTFLSKYTIATIEELEEKIEDSKQWIQDIESRLFMWATVNPKDVIPEEWKDEPIDFIRNSVRTLLESLSEESEKLSKLNTLLDYVKSEKITDLKTLQS